MKTNINIIYTVIMLLILEDRANEYKTKIRLQFF